MTDRPTALTHRPLLDGVRGVLMAVVVCFHLGGVVGVRGGWVAMDLFFVLSGFLITTLLVKERTDTGRTSLVAFYRRRVRRLAPSLLVVLAAVAVVVIAAGWSDQFPGLRGDGLASLFYVANWHFIWSDQSYFSSFQVSPLRHTWSLAIEEQFYVLWPVLFLALAPLLRAGRRGRVVASVILGGGALASAWWMRHLVLGGADLSRAYYGTDTRAQGLLVGALLAVVLWPGRWDTDGGRRVASVVGTVGAAALAVMIVTLSDDDPAVYTRFGFLAIGLACAALVFGAVRAERGPLAWVFGNRTTRHLGRVSYVAYLWHWPVIVLLAPPRVDLPAWQLTWLRLGLTIVLAEATHRYVEDPIHRGRVRFRFDGLALTGSVAVVAALLLALPSSGDGSMLAEDRAVDVVAGRTDAAERVLVLGDSVAWALTSEAPDDLPFRVESVARARCDIIGDRIYAGDRIDEASIDCPSWPADWTAGLSGDGDLAGDPDVVVVTLGLRQLFDLDVAGERVVVGSTDWERRYRAAVRRAVAVVRSGTDAPILWLDVPCFRWAEARSAGEEADPARIAVVNDVLADELADVPGVEVVPYRDLVCPDDVLDERMRSDGAHPIGEAAAEIWHDLLVPRVEAAMADR
ncbi:MAG: acyltransferase [Actinobacteria bacterium]|nr:acyltransferase [Actinomycetota bacterium]